jgi:hypothetical protein
VVQVKKQSVAELVGSLVEQMMRLRLVRIGIKLAPPSLVVANRFAQNRDLRHPGVELVQAAARSHVSVNQFQLNAVVGSLGFTLAKRRCVFVPIV